MRLSDLLGLKVETESGDRLGRVYDVRVERDPRSSSEHAGQRWELKGLVVGRKGAIERFGVRAQSASEPILTRGAIPWSAVVRIREGVAVVRDEARPE